MDVLKDVASETLTSATLRLPVNFTDALPFITPPFTPRLSVEILLVSSSSALLFVMTAPLSALYVPSLRLWPLRSSVPSAGITIPRSDQSQSALIVPVA